MLNVSALAAEWIEMQMRRRRVKTMTVSALAAEWIEMLVAEGQA